LERSGSAKESHNIDNRAFEAEKPGLRKLGTRPLQQKLKKETPQPVQYILIGQ
jgi:hypothetical protein